MGHLPLFGVQIFGHGPPIQRAGVLNRFLSPLVRRVLPPPYAPCNPFVQRLAILPSDVLPRAHAAQFAVSRKNLCNVGIACGCARVQSSTIQSLKRRGTTRHNTTMCSLPVHTGKSLGATCFVDHGKTLSLIPASDWDATLCWAESRVGFWFSTMPKSVLVVDDNAAIRQALCRAFTSEADFDVCGEAENGRDAIEKASSWHPDLIVMDLSMPVMNGLDAARALKTLMPNVPVIMFSEYSDVFSEQEARSAGISALLSKGEHVSVLIDKARALLYPAAA